LRNIVKQTLAGNCKTKYGKDKFRNLLDGSSSITEYEITKLRSKYDIATQDGKVAFLDEFCKLISNLESPIEEDLFMQRISTELLVSKDAIKAQVKNLRTKKSYAKRKQEDKNIRVFASNPRGANYDPQREQNLRYALAEDKLIASIMLHPDLAKFIGDRIVPEQFVTDSNKLIYKAIYDRIKTSDPFTMEYLSSVLEISAMNRLASIVANNEGRSFDQNMAEELIDVVLEKKDRATEEQVAQMSTEDVAKMVEKMAQKKK